MAGRALDGLAAGMSKALTMDQGNRPCRLPDRYCTVTNARSSFAAHGSVRRTRILVDVKPDERPARLGLTMESGWLLQYVAPAKTVTHAGSTAAERRQPFHRH